MLSEKTSCSTEIRLRCRLEIVLPLLLPTLIALPFEQSAHRNLRRATRTRQGSGSRIIWTALNGAVALLALVFAGRLPAQTPDGFNAAADGAVYAMAVQPDGKIIAVGSFSSLAGQPRNFIGRFNEDGRLDPTFDPQIGGNYLCCLAVQPDGKIVAGGRISSVAGTPTGCLIRLNADGSLDSSFVDPGANRLGVQTVALQADGKVVVGGAFNMLGGQTWWHLGRLNTNGTLDTTFTGQADNEVWCVIVQPDGKIVVGGMFNYLGGQLSPRYGRLNSNGSWDSSFRPNSSENVWWVATLTLQADGKILAGGFFDSLGGAVRANIGRLNADGTADAGFAPIVGGWVYSMVPQVDGKILVGTSWGDVLRFLANGTLDSTFSAPTDRGIFSITMQQDGKVLVSGEFSTLGGAPRSGLGRLNNTSPAIESMAWNGSTLTWLRSGTGPEIWRTSFDATPDGTNWINLGAGTRTGSGWQVIGTDIPSNATFRARGAVAGGYQSGVNWLLERSLGPLLLTSQPVSRTNNAATPAFFSVTAVGTPPLGYHWFKDGQPLLDGGLISGAGTSTLIFSNVFAGDRGNYSVVVTNESGSVTSCLASLNVVDPLFTVQPVSQLTNFGNAVTFTVIAAGTGPLSYHWWKEDLKLEADGNIAGSANLTLTISNVSGADRGGYWASVTNVYGCVTSSVATLSVVDPVITAQPTSQLATLGETVVFSATVLGSDALNHQWRKNAIPLSGQTTSTLTLTNVQWLDAGTYDLVVTNSFGSATSSPASLAFPATVDPFNPGVSNTVYGLAVQPDGCTIVAGSFTAVGSQARTNLARLRPDGSLDPLFNPGISGAGTVINILALLDDGRLLIGGRFTNINGQSRTNLARLNPDGSLDASFDTRMTGNSVNALAVQSDGSVVVGGGITSAGGRARANLCRIGADGAVDATFTSGASSTVNCLAIQDDGRILVGGGFTSLAGQSRYSLGRLAPDGTLDDSFNPGVSGGVFTLAVQANGGIVVGGTFTQLGGVSKANLGRLKPDGSLDTNFASTANGGIYSLVLQANGKILAGGVFTQLGGQGRSYLGRLDANGSLDATFNPGADSYVYSLALQPDGGILAGGNFETLGGQPRSRLGRLSNTESAIDVLTVDSGTIISWLRNGATPEIMQVSFDVSTSGTSWISLGAATRISGGWELSGVTLPPSCTVLARGLVAEGYQGGSWWGLNASFGPAAFTSQPASRTNASGTTAGFSVQAVGTSPLSYQWCKDGTPVAVSSSILGAASSTLLLSNVFGADAGAYTVIVSNSYSAVTSLVAALVVIDPVIVSQPTNQLATNGQTVAFQVLAVGSGNLTYQWRKNGVELDGTTNSILTLTNVQWADGGNYDVMVTGSYGTAVSAMAALAFKSGADGFNPSASGTFYAVAVQPDGAILTGGSFSSLGGYSRINIGRLGTDGSADAAFNPGANGTVYCLAVQTDGRILVGGQFTTLGSGARSYLGRLNFDGTLDAAFSPAVSSNVYAIALQPDGKLVLGGAFTNLCGQPRKYVGRLNADGTLDTTFNSTANDIVYSMTLQLDNRIVVGGAFTNLSGVARRCIGRLNADGTLDPTFNPGANTNVHSLALQPDGKILVAGRFTTLAGRNCAYLGRLNPDGSPDTAFSGGANAAIYCLCVQADGRILAGGNFTTLGGQARSCLGRLNGDGSLDASFNPGAGSYVYALALQEDGRILAGGAFTSLGGQTRRGLGRLTNSYPATQALNWDGANLNWLRTGSCPEFWRVSFDVSTNGTDWQPRGEATRTSWGWQSVGMNQPSNATVRARGLVAGSYQAGSSWLVETNLGNPAISIQPQARTNNATTPATFYVLAAGASPLSYQWFKNGVSLADGGVVSGVHSNLLKLSSVLAPQAGDYSVVVSNTWGCVTSAIAMLAVSDPCITAQPANRANNAGTIATFTVQAAGSALLGYQWLKDGMIIADEGNLSGTRTTTLRITNVLGSDRAGYTVIVSNAYGCATSRVATLSVVDPIVVVQPTNQYLNAGQTATFNVLGFGSPTLSYQWRKDGVGLAGAINSFLTLSNVQRQDIGTYDVILTGPFGSTISTGAVLVVNLSTADSLNPDTDGYVAYLAIQTDGKILMGGPFNMVGEPHTNLARLNMDGSLDDSFIPPAFIGSVYGVALQTDSKILVGGSYWIGGSFPRTNLARLNSDGTVDATFNADDTKWKATVAVQPDGKVLAGGGYGLDRFHSNGTLDSSFTRHADGVDCLAVQPDGKILIARRYGSFLARLHSNGAVDGSFVGRAGYFVYSLALQPDGRILVSGDFTTLNGQPRNYLGRLHSDGALDTTFIADANELVTSVTLQADGRIVIGGSFTSVSGQPRHHIARLELDGRLDNSFNPGANAWVGDLAIQEDGAIVIAGSFDTVGGQNRSGIARLRNTDPASQNMTWIGDTISWLRGGTSPEFWRMSFESSTNDVDWESLGNANPVAGGWQLTSLALPDSASIRARGFVSGGASAGSVWFIEKILPPRPKILNDGAMGFVNHFGFNLRALSHQTVVVEGSTNLLDWTPVATNAVDAIPQFFSDHESKNFGMRFYRLRLQE